MIFKAASNPKGRHDHPIPLRSRPKPSPSRWRGRSLLEARRRKTTGASPTTTTPAAAQRGETAAAARGLLGIGRWLLPAAFWAWLAIAVGRALESWLLGLVAACLAFIVVVSVLVPVRATARSSKGARGRP